MFGRGKFQNGVLIDPKPQFALDPNDEVKLEEFRNLIWRVFALVLSPEFSALTCAGQP
jgi:hypothetical protein